MNKIAPSEGFLILEKWFEERTFLRLDFFNGTTGYKVSCWVLISRTSADKSILFSIMEPPFEFLRIEFGPNLEFEHGEAEFESPLDSVPPVQWTRFLRLTWRRSDDTLLLAEVYRDYIHEIPE